MPNFPFYHPVPLFHNFSIIVPIQHFKSKIPNFIYLLCIYQITQYFQYRKYKMTILPFLPKFLILAKIADFLYTENISKFHYFFQIISTHDLSITVLNFTLKNSLLICRNRSVQNKINRKYI